MSEPLFDEDEELYNESQLQDESEPESSEEDEPLVKKTRGKKSRTLVCTFLLDNVLEDYEVVRLFESRAEYVQWWEGEKNKWKVGDRHSNLGADTDFYRCRFSRYANT